MDKQSFESMADEEARIRAAYAKRQGDFRYSWFNPGHLLMTQQQERRLMALLKQRGVTSLDTTQILEIGCGTGRWLREFIKWGARPENVIGIDLLPNRVSEARRLSPETLRVDCGSAVTLDFPDATFDLVFQATVFTSILDARMKQQIASEMLRVLRPDGFILWYDYHVDNPRNPDVRGVKKREIYRLFPGCQFKLERITLAPPLSRSLAPYSWLLCCFLESIPLLCTHYLGVIQKGGNDAGAISAISCPRNRR